MFRDGIAGCTGYLARHHPEEYRTILGEFDMPPLGGEPGPDDFVEWVRACYRTNFDPSGLATELATLRDEHDRLVDRWTNLPMQRAKDTASERLTGFAVRIENPGRAG